MNGENLDRNNYDVVSITKSGKAKRANYIQDAQHMDKEKIRTTGSFIRVFSDIFLKREAGHKAYF